MRFGLDFGYTNDVEILMDLVDLNSTANHIKPFLFVEILMDLVDLNLTDFVDTYIPVLGRDPYGSRGSKLTSI